MAGHIRPLDRHDFEIAIICALKREHDAVEAILDEEYEIEGSSYGKASGDHNAYTTGRIGNHQVVLAYMPRMGKVNSAAVASSIRTSFSGIKLALVVGVCGGAPTTINGTDIFLGDVLISTKVVQYDFGRRYPNQFLRKDNTEGNLGQPSPEIRSFLARLSGQLVHQRLKIKTALYSTKLCQKPGLRSSTYPGSHNDKLYQSHYRHKHRETAHCPLCDQCQNEGDEVCETALTASCAELGCDDESSISRTRTNRVGEPMIHFGPVASGEGVIKSSQHRDDLVRHDKVIAFEMEGAGAWDFLPTLVVKSVSDYADSHKSEKWQAHAAVNSAACAKAVLEEWRSKQISIGNRSLLSRSKDIKKDCLLSLSFPTIDARRQSVVGAHPTTCNWLFSTAQFRKWERRDDIASFNGVLWIKGKPGAGKSTLMKHAFHYHQNKFPNHVIAAYFFNARGDTLERSPLGMLRSLLYQLLDQSPQFCNDLMKLIVDKRKKHGEIWEWYKEELKNFLLEMMKRHQHQPITIFLDALDECDDSEVRKVVMFLEELSLEASASKTILSICLSSRHYPAISMKIMSQLVVERNVEHDRDITIYVKDKLRARDPAIEIELLEKAGGISMWIVLVIEMLNQAFDEGRLRAMEAKLRTIPSDLDEVFREIIEKDNTAKDETALLFQWVLYCIRPLEPEELYFAIMAGTDQMDHDPWDQSKTTMETIERFIISASRGLVELRKLSWTTTVQFIHESVKDFLVRNKRLRILDTTAILNDSGTSHDRLASCCLSYLEMEALQAPARSLANKEEDGPIHLYDLDSAVVRKYPFLQYASRCALQHIEKAHFGGVPQYARVQELQTCRH